MALYVATNSSSLNAQRFLNKATQGLDASYKNLSSGLRINSAKDDAAGLQISDRMTSQIEGLSQGNRNCLDGISMLQVAEGALDEITNMLQRIRTLAIQSANGTNSHEERMALQQEVHQLSTEINRIAKDTTYGGQPILDGEQEYLYFNSDKKIMPISNTHPKDPAVSCRDPKHTVKTKDIQVGADAYQTVELKLGIHTNKVYCNQGCKRTFTPNSVLVGFDLNGLYCSVVDIDNPIYQIDTENNPGSFNENEHKTGLFYGSDNQTTLDVSTPDAAQMAIKISSDFIKSVDSHRAEMGAIQNRLESAISNQENIIENVSDTRSRIRDCDYAGEVARQVSFNILQQAAASVLTQANMKPDTALRLLNGGNQ